MRIHVLEVTSLVQLVWLSFIPSKHEACHGGTCPQRAQVHHLPPEDQGDVPGGGEGREEPG